MTVERYLMEALKTSPVYVEDVFSTYLYTGNGSTQTITNNIDLSTKGGMVWSKSRNLATNNQLNDTARGATYSLFTNTTGAQINQAAGFNSFSSSGYILQGDNPSVGSVNASGNTYVSWTFRKQPKFFDVVTFTAGFADQTVSHSLGSTPGMIIIKATASAGQNWYVYHKSIPSNFLALNLTDAVGSPAVATSVNSSSFVFNGAYYGAGSSATYVAYLFADQAGGFGLSGSDSVVACGSLTTDGSQKASVTLGWEPQFVIVKCSSAASSWIMLDNMRGWDNGASDKALLANSSNAEANVGQVGEPTATGFNVAGLTASSTFIYLAIRRGPMKVPTSGTSVFYPSVSSATVGTVITTNFTSDMQIVRFLTFNGDPNPWLFDRLRGVSSTSTEVANSLITSTTAAEITNPSFYTNTRAWTNTGYSIDSYSSGANTSRLNFQRAPGYMDVVCYTGTGVARTVAHNLGVAPELIIVKKRNSSAFWVCWGGNMPIDYLVYPNYNYEAQSAGSLTFNNTLPTASVFSLGIWTYVNNANDTYVAYLFATCPGVSKVGSYTGTGAAQNIDCGFSAGARFILIKRTDSTGDWYVYDSARGISSGNDPYFFLNSNASEVTGTNYVDTFASGFTLTATAPAALNANGGSYLFLAIA